MVHDVQVDRREWHRLKKSSMKLSLPSASRFAFNYSLLVSVDVSLSSCNKVPAPDCYEETRRTFVDEGAVDQQLPAFG